MTCLWISSKNADHTQKDTYFESFGREKGTQYPVLLQLMAPWKANTLILILQLLPWCQKDFDSAQHDACGLLGGHLQDATSPAEEHSRKGKAGAESTEMSWHQSCHRNVRAHRQQVAPQYTDSGFFGGYIFITGGYLDCVQAVESTRDCSPEEPLFNKWIKRFCNSTSGLQLQNTAEAGSGSTDVHGQMNVSHQA